MASRPDADPLGFTATLTRAADGSRVYLPVPFDPDLAWGAKPRHHVAGSVNGAGLRGVIEDFGTDRGIALGPVWRQDRGFDAGARVDAVIWPEGPQRTDLPDDVAAAFATAPAAGAFFDGLAQFYRKAYLRWIAGASRRPQERTRRIAELIELLKAGQKARPGR